MQTWYERANARRKELGLTQEWLADQFEMTTGAMQKWLAGKREPSLEDINRIADLLTCSPVWLTHGVGSVTAVLALPAPEGIPAQSDEGAPAVVHELRNHQRQEAYWPFSVSPERVRAALRPEHIALIEAHMMGLVQASEMQSQASRTRNSRSVSNGQP